MYVFRLVATTTETGNTTVAMIVAITLGMLGEFGC